MANWRQCTALGLIVAVLHVSSAEIASAKGATTAPEPLIRQQIEQFGKGARIKVQLTSGERLRGSIAAMDDESFLLAAGQENSPRRVAFDQVAQLKYAKSTYRASGRQDPVEARRVVAGLGIGRHIMVKTAAGREYHGDIQAIASDQFTILPDHQTVPVQIAYTDAAQLGPNLSTLAKVAIVVAVAITIFVVWAIHNYGQQ